MIETPRKQPPARDWRALLAIGLGTGLGVAVARSVTGDLEPTLGYGTALAVSLVAAGAIGGFVAWVVGRLAKPRGRGHGGD